MKKLLFSMALVLTSLSAFAQTYKNEVKLNILNVIAVPSVELGYEYYLDDNQSVDGELFFIDRFSYFPKNGGKFNATSFKVGYNYYFDSTDAVGVYLNPFIKARFGKYTKDYQHACEKFIIERRRFKKLLDQIPFIHVIPSQANYFLTEITSRFTSKQLTQKLLNEYNILIKDCDNKDGLKGKNYIRIAIRTKEDNNRLVAALKSI